MSDPVLRRLDVVIVLLLIVIALLLGPALPGLLALAAGVVFLALLAGVVRGLLQPYR